MIRSLYTAASGMEAQELKMDTISNNLANASTTGFKKNRAEFEDVLSETLRPAGAPDARGNAPPSPLQVGLGVKAAGTQRTFRQGDMIGTQNPLDVAIEGVGFFRVQRANGDQAFTRAGNFRVDALGRLATAQGELVTPEITVPPDATAFDISNDGKVTARVPGRDAPQELGQLELTLFTNPAGLQALGQNLFSATPASGAPTPVRPGELGAGRLSQGYLEGSNVKAVEEMVELISTQRAYELNSRVIQTADQMLQKLTSMR